MRIYFKLVHIVLFSSHYFIFGCWWCSLVVEYLVFIPPPQPWLVSTDVHQNFFQVFIIKCYVQVFFLHKTDFFDQLYLPGFIITEIVYSRLFKSKSGIKQRGECLLSQLGHEEVDILASESTHV